MSAIRRRLRKVKGKLLLDSKAGIAKGGVSGPALVPGDVEKSLLIQAIRWTDADLAMPPKGKLSARQIERFERWVKIWASRSAFRAGRRERRKRRKPSISKPAESGGRFSP